jgi:hypothetical protein
VTKQNLIAAFLERRVLWPRMASPSWGYPTWDYPYPWAQRLTVEQLAQELLQDAELRALQLGTWLGTTDGRIIVAAVESISPPFYRVDVELLVAALQRVADLQRQEGQQAAARYAAAAIGIAGVVALGIAAFSPTDTA